MPRERKKGFFGQTINGQEITKLANQIYALQYGKDYTECKVDDLLFVTLHEKDDFGNNKYALICTEGVGWVQDEYGCIEVPTNIGPMGMWNGRVFVSVDVIKQYLVREETDIADYVRVFGDRLDNNCFLWQSKMSVPSDMVIA